MRNKHLNPKAVLFDMDGVIVDSMPYHYISWYEALRPLGIRVSCFDIFQREGERWDKTLLDYLITEQIKPGPALLKKVFISRRKIFNKYFKRTIFNGVSEILTCLKNKDYRLGLVTGTPLNEVKNILPLRIRKFFNVLVTGDMLKRGKPHPDPYLKAAAALGLKPAECLVIENAPLGIESAKKAGMFCIAITTSLPAEFLQQADVIVNKLDEIPPIIDKTCSL